MAINYNPEGPGEKPRLILNNVREYAPELLAFINSATGII